MLDSGQSPKPNDNVDLVRAIDDLVEKCIHVLTLSYRQLRVFSGVNPVPAGEEEYDTWMEQAVQMISEWQCADTIKKQHIVESLQGPHSFFFKSSNPDATTSYAAYLAALETMVILKVILICLQGSGVPIKRRMKSFQISFIGWTSSFIACL